MSRSSSDLVDGLRAAVRSGDQLAARRLLHEAPADLDDEVLGVLAGLASAEEVSGALATELVVERLDESGMVRRMVGAALLDRSAVDDVSQDCLISVAGSLASFRGGSKVSTWVHSIVRRRVVDHLRRQRATAPLPEDDLSPTQRMSSMIATRATVQEALASLPDRYREPVVLRDMEGLSYAEVADRLDRNLGTVKAQISRGRALVASALRSDGEQLV